MPILFLLFVAVPIIEIAVLLRVGSSIGWFTTLVVVITTAALGTWMLRQQGMKTLQTARARMGAGQLPANEMLEGVVLLFGGAMLLTPGFLTDATGFLCLLPASRRWIAHRIARQVRVRGGNAAFGRDGGPGGAGGAAPGPRPGGDRMNERFEKPGASGGTGGRRKGGDVIDGEYERID